MLKAGWRTLYITGNTQANLYSNPKELSFQADAGEEYELKLIKLPPAHEWTAEIINVNKPGKPRQRILLAAD